MIFALDGRQRANGMSLMDGLGVDFAHAPVLYFALFHQVGNSRCYLFCRGVGVGTVLVEHGKRIESEATERLFAIATDGLRPTVLTSRAFSVDYFVSEFSRYVNPAFELGQCFSG